MSGRIQEKLESLSGFGTTIVAVILTILTCLLGYSTDWTLKNSESIGITLSILLFAMVVIILIAYTYRRKTENQIRDLLEEVRALAVQTALLTEVNLYSEYLKRTKNARKKVYILGSGKFYIERLEKKEADYFEELKKKLEKDSRDLDCKRIQTIENARIRWLGEMIKDWWKFVDCDKLKFMEHQIETLEGIAIFDDDCVLITILQHDRTTGVRIINKDINKFFSEYFSHLFHYHAVREFEYKERFHNEIRKRKEQVVSAVLPHLIIEPCQDALDTLSPKTDVEDPCFISEVLERKYDLTKIVHDNFDKMLDEQIENQGDDVKSRLRALLQDKDKVQEKIECLKKNESDFLMTTIRDIIKDKIEEILEKFEKVD